MVYICGVMMRHPRKQSTTQHFSQWFACRFCVSFLHICGTPWSLPCRNGMGMPPHMLHPARYSWFEENSQFLPPIGSADNWIDDCLQSHVTHLFKSQNAGGRWALVMWPCCPSAPGFFGIEAKDILAPSSGGTGARKVVVGVGNDRFL